MFDPPPDQPQSIGDLIGRAFRLYKRNFPLFFSSLLGPTIVSAAGAIGLQWTVSYVLAGSNGNFQVIGLNLGILLLSLVALLLSKWVLTIRQLAFVRLSTGFSPNYPAAAAYVGKRKWSLLGLFVLSLVVTLFMVLGMGILAALIAFLPLGSSGFLAAIVIAIVATLTGLVVAISLYVAAFVILSVLSCEDLDLGAIISRGLELTLGNILRSCAFGVLLIIAVMAFSCPLSLPVASLSLFDFAASGLASAAAAESYKMPVYIMAIVQAWQAIVDMLLWPIIFLSAGLFYYDLRLRQEGLDMLRNLQLLVDRTD